MKEMRVEDLDARLNVRGIGQSWWQAYLQINSVVSKKSKDTAGCLRGETSNVGKGRLRDLKGQESRSFILKSHMELGQRAQ